MATKIKKGDFVRVKVNGTLSIIGNVNKAKVIDFEKSKDRQKLANVQFRNGAIMSYLVSDLEAYVPSHRSFETKTKNVIAQKQLYRVKLNKPKQLKTCNIFGTACAVRGFLGVKYGKIKEIKEFSLQKAMKEATIFDGVVVEAPIKKVKKESFKLWIAIEKHTQFTDGTEKEEDIEMTDAYPLTISGDIKTEEEAYKKAEEIMNQIYPA